MNFDDAIVFFFVVAVLCGAALTISGLLCWVADCYPRLRAFMAGEEAKQIELLECSIREAEAREKDLCSENGILAAEVVKLTSMVNRSRSTIRDLQSASDNWQREYYPTRNMGEPLHG